MSTLQSGALPTGDTGVAATAFLIWCYAAATHLDPGDLDLTVALRIYRDNREHPWAHHFLYGTLASTSPVYANTQGVLIKQDTGTMWLFDASKYWHGSSIAVNRIQPRHSTGIAMVLKKTMFSWLHNA